MLQVTPAGEKRLNFPGFPPDRQPIVPPNVYITATVNTAGQKDNLSRNVLRNAGLIEFRAAQPPDAPAWRGVELLPAREEAGQLEEERLFVDLAEAGDEEAAHRRNDVPAGALTCHGFIPPGGAADSRAPHMMYMSAAGVGCVTKSWENSNPAKDGPLKWADRVTGWL